MIKKIEIKNLKVVDHLREGTLAFTASVWVNGKKWVMQRTQVVGV